MEKKRMSFNVGRLAYDEAKNELNGFVNGEYCAIKLPKAGESWGVTFFVNASRDVTFFDVQPRDQSQQNNRA